MEEKLSTLMAEFRETIKANNQHITASTNPTELHLYLKDKVSELEEELKLLQEERMLMEQKIKEMGNKIAELPMISSINKTSLMKKFEKEEYPKFHDLEETIASSNQIKKKHHESARETRLQTKINLMTKELSKMKIYTEEIEYRLLMLIKVLGLEDEIKMKESSINTIKAERRKSLEEYYDREIIEIKLLKFVLSNLKRKERSLYERVNIINDSGNENNGRMIYDAMTCHEPLFTITGRGYYENAVSKVLGESNNRVKYLHKSVEKENRVRMKPVIKESDTEEDEEYKENVQYHYHD